MSKSEGHNTLKYKALISVFVATIILTAYALPVFAIDYNVGVTVGQYVKFGNFDAGGVGPYEDYSWVKVSVDSISGKEVTLLVTGRLQGGGPTPNNGLSYVWNIEEGTIDGSYGTEGPIIAANLNAGDPIPPADSYTVTKTENRVYLGTVRTVCVLVVTSFGDNYTDRFEYVYDRASGMMLEMSEAVEGPDEASTYSYSYSVTETNIFSSGSATATPTPQQTTTAPTTTAPTTSASTSSSAQPTQTTTPNGDSGFPVLYIVVAVVVIAAVAVGLGLIMKKRK